MTTEEALNIVNNADVADLMGYAGLERQDLLLGAISKMPIAQKAMATKKLLTRQAAGGASLSSRDEAVIRVGALPAHIQKGLSEKRLQLVDAVMYTTKTVAAVSDIRMFENDDTKAPGDGNVSRQQLDKDNYFLVTGIRVLSGVDAGGKKVASYGVLAKEIANGDFEFKANGKYLMPKDNSLNIFNTTNKTDVLTGYVKLDNPKWIEPQVDIVFDARFASAAAANTHMRIELIGVMVQPY